MAHASKRRSLALDRAQILHQQIDQLIRLGASLRVMGTIGTGGAEGLTPDRHIACPMRWHRGAAIDDPANLRFRKPPSLAMCDLSEVGYFDPQAGRDWPPP